MDIPRELLAACVAAPADDGPRHVWADAVGGERGELVAVQLRLASGEGTPAEVGALLARQRALLTAHGVAWSGLAGTGVTTVRFGRGFVDAIAIDARALADRGEAIAAAAPLCHGLALTGLHVAGSAPATEALVEELLVGWGARPLTALQLAPHGFDMGGGRPSRTPTPAFTEAAIATLARRGVLRGLASLTMSHVDRAVDELLRSNQIAQLTRLTISARDPGAVRALVRGLPRLEAFAVPRGIPVPDVVDALSATVRELTLPLEVGASYDLDPGLHALAASRLGPGLETLRLGGGRLRLDASAVARLPRLASLDLGAVILWDEAQASFLACELPALRSLRLMDHGRDDPVPAAFHTAVATRFGARLDALMIAGDRVFGPPTVEPLRPLVAGDVHAARTAEPWIDPSPPPRAPAWEHATVVLPGPA